MSMRRWLAGLVGAALCLVGWYVGWSALRAPATVVAGAPATVGKAPAPRDADTPMAPTASAKSTALATGAAPAPPRHKLVLCDERNIVEAETEGGFVLRDSSVKPNAGAGLLDAIREALASRGDAKSQAAGLYLAAIESSFEQRLCSGNNCDSQKRAAAKAASALASFARDAKTPAIYAWALAACATAQADPIQVPACSGFSAQHWADAAPNSVWPWLELAADARRRNDPSGLESAMHRASLAGDWVHPGDEAWRLIASSLPARATTQEYLEGTVRLTDMHAGKQSGISSLTRYCDANQDANKRQVCTRLADGLLTSAKDLFQLGIAIKVGERSGLDKDRLDRAAQQRAEAERGFAATTAMFSRTPTLGGPTLACRFTDMQAQLHLRAAEVGEVAAGREWARSHRP